MNRPFVVPMAGGTVVCLPAWLFALIIVAVGGAEAYRRLSGD